MRNVSPSSVFKWIVSIFDGMNPMVYTQAELRDMREKHTQMFHYIKECGRMSDVMISYRGMNVLDRNLAYALMDEAGYEWDGEDWVFYPDKWRARKNAKDNAD